MLQFRIAGPTAYRFLQRFRKLLPTNLGSDRVFFFAQYLQEICLLDSTMLKHRASEMAAACLIISVESLTGAKAWSKEIEQVTKMLLKDLACVIEDVRGFVTEVNVKFLTTLKYKFQKMEYCEVASISLDL